MNNARIKSIVLALAIIVTSVGSTSNCSAEPVFGITSGGDLVRFDSDAPGTILSATTTSGLGTVTGPRIKSIDFRPSNRKLYAIASQTNLGSGNLELFVYTVDLATAVATRVAASSAVGIEPGGVTVGLYGMDIDPQTDTIRYVDGAGHNLRLNPDTGALSSTDTALSFAIADENVGQTPTINCIGYDNNAVGSLSTTLFGVDTALNKLVRLGSTGGSPISPNVGQLFTVGGLGISSNASVGCGLDVSTLSGSTYLAASTGSSTAKSLYSVGIAGNLLSLGAIGIASSDSILDVALPVAETTVPTVTVTQPVKQQFKTKKSSIMVTGTSLDDTLVESVIYSTRAGGLTKFKTAMGSTSWSFSAKLRLGGNKIRIKSVDIFGNESEVTTLRVTRKKK